MNTLPSSWHFRTHQYGGATLLFVLIMLLVVSIIGVSAARSTLIQERMASNTEIHNIVFEAAESALAAGEIRVANTPEIWKIPGTTGKPGECANGVCDRHTAVLPRWISNPSFWDNTTEVSEIETVESGPIKVEKPKYIIEDLGQTMASCDPNHIDITKSAECLYTSAQRYFRVVSFAKAYQTQVMLQSTYLDPNPTREPVTAAAEWNAKDPECGGNPYQPPGQTCCPADPEHPNKEWVYNGTTCPSYCEVGPGEQKKYDPDQERCCDPNPANNERKIIASTEKCPVYCGNNVIDESKEVCCNVQGTWSVYPGTNRSVDCPQFCGNNPRGAGQVCCWKGSEQYSYTANSESDCPKFCDVGGTQTLIPANHKCCPNASKTGYELINGECPNYCDNKILGPNQTCCPVPGGERIVGGGRDNCPKFCGTQEIFPGQECCGSSPTTQKIFDPSTQKCCEGSNNAIAIIRINEFCCTDQHGNKVANPTEDCPIYCGHGNNAIRIYPPGEACCTPYITWGTPVKAGSGEQCCGSVATPKTASGICPETCNGQSYDPGFQTCCHDYDTAGNERQHSVADKNNCPMFCNAPGGTQHNKQLAPGQICCTDKSADTYGEIGQCIGGSGQGPGS